MEAVKNGLTRFGRHSWALIVDPASDLIADACDGNLDETPGRREAHCIVDDGVDGPREAVRLAHNHRRILSRTGEGEPGVAGLAARLPAVDELFDQRSKIDPLEGGSSKLGIRSSRFADVADQPVEPGNILSNDTLQLLPE